MTFRLQNKSQIISKSYDVYLHKLIRLHKFDSKFNNINNKHFQLLLFMN